MPDETDVPGIENFVFDDNNQERKSWKFGKLSIPRSEVVYFTQIFVVLIIIAGCFARLWFVTTCEETTLWAALLTGTVGYVLPNPKK